MSDKTYIRLEITFFYYTIVYYHNPKKSINDLGVGPLNLVLLPKLGIILPDGVVL